MSLRSLNKKGFTTLSLAMMILIIPTATLVGIRFYSAIQKGVQIQKSTTTKNQLISAKNWLINNAQDADSDGFAELIKENTGNTLPLTLPMKSTDDYGTTFRYYTWDLGTANANAIYSQNFTAPPIAGLIGRVISAGKDGIFQTSASSTTPQGDDIVVDIYNTDVLNNTNTSGWIEDVVNNKITQKTPGRWVGINITTPQGTELFNVAGTGKFSSALIGSGPAGYYQDSNNGAYRSMNAAGNTAFYFQGYNAITTVAYIGLQGAYAGRTGFNTVTPGYTVDVNGSFRTAAGSLALISDYFYASPTSPNTFNSGYFTNGADSMWINYRGYLDGFTQPRNLNIGNGKGGNIAYFDAVNQRMSINNGASASYTLDVNGDVGMRGNQIFTLANPTITASSWINIPNGIYVSTGNIKADQAIYARGGLQNDTGATLDLMGGTTGNTRLVGTPGVNGLVFPDGSTQTTAAQGNFGYYSFNPPPANNYSTLYPGTYYGFGTVTGGLFTGYFSRSDSVLGTAGYVADVGDVTLNLTANNNAWNGAYFSYVGVWGWTHLKMTVAKLPVINVTHL